jgi:hypothetical protein
LSAGSDVRLWFINAGATLPQHIAPALAEIAERNAAVEIKTRILFMDSVSLPGHSRMTRLVDRSFQAKLDRRIKDSGFLTNRAPHADLVQQGLNRLALLAMKHKNFKYEARLSLRLPPGRMMFFDDVGYFAPYGQELTAGLPVFVFHKKAPFYRNALSMFDEAFSSARQLRTVG